MKKILSMFFVLSLVVGLAVSAGADEKLSGKVVSIDSDGQTMVIDTASGPKTVSLRDDTKGLKGLKTGADVEVICIDLEGKSCAKKITVVSAKEAGRATGTEVEGEVVSIDQAKKAVVIKAQVGRLTIYYQKASKGTPLTSLQVGRRIKAYCIDSEGKTCIKNIQQED